MLPISQVIQSIRKFIDLRIAISGSIVMGGIVFSINYFETQDSFGSMTASLKQGFYTFLFGGVLMKSCQLIAINIRRTIPAIILSVLIPSVFTMVLTIAMHSLKGTPKPIESTLPTLIIIPATLVWAIVSRRNLKNKSNC
jgi:hypothetical protein